MTQRLDKACDKCGNKFSCDAKYHENPICPDCLKREFAEKHTNETAANVIKNQFKVSKEFNFDTQDQKITAVLAQGEVFASQAGPDLMLTEFVENSFDAIKKEKVHNAIPDALKKMNVDKQLEDLAFDRHTLPAKDFSVKYEKLSNEQELFLESLWNEICIIIKSQSKKPVTITVDINDDTRQVQIIDSGTGIQYPIHISEKPFVSLKTGEDYTTGKFGRGSQVFRAFCELMQFNSVRKSPSDEELKEFEKQNWNADKIDSKSVKIDFPYKYPGGEIDWEFTSNDYKKLSGNTETGTVVVLDKWREDYFNTLTKHVKKLESRLQHHFGFGLDDMFNISLKIKHNKKEIDIIKMDFDELAKPENPTKIDAKFDLPEMQLTDKNGKSCGKIEFHIHKTHRSYNHPYKAPFLIVNGRPLGDTSLAEIPELQSYSDLWKSSTVTGYVICDTVELNQMRTGLAPNVARQPFFDSMKAASITLKGLNSAWKNELSSAQDKDMANEVIQKVSNYLSKQGIKFNFKNPLEKGAQKNPNEKSGEDITDERVSNVDSGPNQGLIDSQDGDSVQVGYRKTKTGPTNGNWNDDTVIVPHGTNKKDGNKVITVKVKRSLVSKGGRRVRKSYSGPGLEFNVDEDSENELSYFESDPPCVWVQSEHQAWKKLVKKSREQTNAEKFEKDKFEYLMERYLWEIINHESTFTGEQMTDAERKDLFWTYYHDLKDTK